jgi:hypothetical protein
MNQPYSELDLPNHSAQLRNGGKDHHYRHQHEQRPQPKRQDAARKGHGDDSIDN